MEPTFAEYIAAIARPRKNARGEFIGYARQEIASGRFPEVNTWMAVSLHLNNNSTLLLAGQRVWSEYRGYLKRQDYARRAIRGQFPLHRLRGLDPRGYTRC